MLAICCCLSAVSGQWLEKTIGLTDSFGSIWPRAVYCLPGSNWVYVADDEDRGVIVVDAATNARVARIDVRSPSFFAYNPQDDKVYLSVEDAVTVIDPSTHQVVARLEVGLHPSVLYYNPAVNKLYCRTGHYGDSITVVDCGTDSVIARIRVGWCEYEFLSMSCASVGSKVYASSFDAGAVAVIDGVGDSLLRLLPVGEYPTALAYSPVSNKLYCSSYADDEVAVFDPGPDTLLGWIEVGGGPLALGYNPVSNKLYSGGGDDPSVDIIDCDSDTVVAAFELPSGDPMFFLFDSVDNRVFCFPDYGQSFTAISGTGDTIVGLVELRVDVYEPNPAGYYPQQNRLYVRGRSSPDVYVVDAAGLGVVADILMNAQPNQGCYVEAHDKFYVSDDESGLIAVINCSTDSLERWIFTPGTELGPPVYCSVSNKLYYNAYLNNGSGLVVVDCSGDSFEAALHPESDMTPITVYNPAMDRIYWYGMFEDTTILVLDCAGDSIVARVPVGGYPLALACNPDSNRIFCMVNHGDSMFVSAIDCASDSVIGTVLVNDGYSSTRQSLCYLPLRDVVVSTVPGSTLIVVDGMARQVVGTVPLSDRLGGAYFDRASNKLYGFMPRSDLAVIDCGDMSFKARLRLAEGPSGIAFDTVAERVYVTSSEGHCLSLVDGRTNRFLGLMDAGNTPGDITWVPQHRKMYVVDQEGQAILVVKDTSHAGVYENSASPVARAMPTVVRGVLFLSGATSRKPQAASLLDISGRKVLDLLPGANDVRPLAPAVYFVREAQAQAQVQAVRKIIVAR
jgi:DNA-binding beta-propeller fold protein YncE